MINPAELETLLQAHLPPTMHAHIPAFIARIVERPDDPHTASTSRVLPEFGAIISALAGKELTASGATITFGAHNQLGDVSIRDVAGQNIYNVTFNTYNLEAPAHPDPAPPKPTSEEAKVKALLADRARLRQLMAERLALEDVYSICFDLGIDHENLPGSGKAAKIRELLTHAEHRLMLEQLARAVLALRPNLLDS